MEDDSGFVAGRVQTRGRGGELLYGHRQVTELDRWTAEISSSEDDLRLKVRLTVKSHEPDPFWFENCPDDDVVLALKFGRKEMEGKAHIVGRFPALVIEAIIQER
jgi:hypothetical protein